MLLKTVATLDVLSGGRAWLGIGPPWHEREQRDMGIPVGSWPERFARLEEILRLTRQVWDGDTTPFAGEHYRLDRPRLCPPPLRRPPTGRRRARAAGAAARRPLRRRLQPVRGGRAADAAAQAGPAAAQLRAGRPPL
ncbi:LLM class flavin-dependent oxidoreductase [Micromonospora sp. b486]|uniref:LLM class flavin-dependent oxidoreductase n=1 Tax=Micromonospora sp. b486 TaxID=3053986 RepID=UPI00259CDFC1|nr:LLM class flavin-dependent oxidoreductase [Micromonospora sp. b486]MDM4784446.1 LLM class flavin-dependent oxidoreductase [Micromonospora sp. b486]